MEKEHFLFCLLKMSSLSHILTADSAFNKLDISNRDAAAALESSRHHIVVKEVGSFHVILVWLLCQETFDSMP